MQWAILFYFSVYFRLELKQSVCTDVGEMIKRVQPQGIRVIIQGRFYGCLPQLAATCYLLRGFNGQPAQLVVFLSLIVNVNVLNGQPAL